MINLDSRIGISAWWELCLEMVPPESLFLTQMPILIFLVRLSEFSNFLENTAVFLQVKSFLFPLLGKVLVPKDAHVLTDALVQSPENVILVEVKLR